MDLENNNNEANALLKKRTPEKRRGLALTLAGALSAAALCAVYMPRANYGSPKLEEVASAPLMDWRTPAVAAPAWSVEDTTRTPYGYCARGGGFRMMSMHMGIARALGEQGWPKVTHIGGASGGYWFGSQMVYSQSFYDNAARDE